MHLYAYTKDNQPQAVVEWTGTAALPSAGIEPIEIPLLPLDATTTPPATISLPAAGRLAAEVHRPDVRHRPGHGDRHRAHHVGRFTTMIRIRRAANGRRRSALGAVVAAVLGVAGPASAHVTVNPNEATQGGYGRVAFRVPNESDTASTTKLEVNLPENAPGRRRCRPCRCRAGRSRCEKRKLDDAARGARQPGHRGGRRRSPGPRPPVRGSQAGPVPGVPGLDGPAARGRTRWSSRRCRPTRTATIVALDRRAGRRAARSRSTRRRC